MNDNAGGAGKILDGSTDQPQQGPGVNQEEVKKDRAENEEQESASSVLKDWVDLLVRAGFWALVIYLFIFQVSVVEGPSMQPTFLDYDRLVIDKLTYRFSSVRRFDVIVFQAVDLGRHGLERCNRDYIKRVIGLPGETVRVRDGRIWINGRKMDEPYGPKYSACSWSGFEDETFVVPPGQYFVMGDNRPDSKDSRQDSLGFVPAGQIRGLVRLRFWPRGRVQWIERGIENARSQ